MSSLLLRLATGVLVSTLAASASTACQIDIPKPLTFEQWKAEVQHRVERGIYPAIGLNPKEVAEVLPLAAAPDCDAWAGLWSSVGDRYMVQGNAALPADPKAADLAFVMAWKYYNFARWPSNLSPGMERAWRKAQEAFSAHGALLDPPMQTVRIPFEGREIVAFLRAPKSDQPLPLVITIGGLDGWKDDMIGRFAHLPASGFAYIAVDSPGTGDAPIAGAPGAERMFSRIIDWVVAQPSFNKDKIFVLGASFGGYWASVLAVTEAARLAGVIDQSGPVSNSSFDPRRLETPTPLPPTFYLANLVPSVSRMLGAPDRRSAEKQWAELSMEKRGLIGRSTAPMLLIAGAKDPLVPMDDVALLLSSGDSPKEAWVNPKGFHMGRQPGFWTDETIFQKVMLPWLRRRSDAKVE